MKFALGLLLPTVFGLLAITAATSARAARSSRFSTAFWCNAATVRQVNMLALRCAAPNRPSAAVAASPTATP